VVARVGRGDSTTYAVGCADDWDPFPDGKVYGFEPSIIGFDSDNSLYKIFVGVRRVADSSLFFGIGRGTFGGAILTRASGECEVLKREYGEKTQDCWGRDCPWYHHRRYCGSADQTP
jgi:hypothetical protein